MYKLCMLLLVYMQHDNTFCRCVKWVTRCLGREGGHIIYLGTFLAGV